MLTRGYAMAFAFRAVMRHIAQHHAAVDFIVSTGDLVDNGLDAEYQQFRRMLGITTTSDAPGPQNVTIAGLQNMPMYFLPGNHDPREAFFRNLFPATALTALNTTFMHKGIQFVCLDWGAENKAIPTPALFPHLTQALQSDAPTIILTHHNVAPSGMAYVDHYIADEIGKFAQLIEGQRVLGIFSGHAHITYTSQVGGVPAYGLRSTMFSFAQCGDTLLRILGDLNYRVVTVTDGQLSTEIVEVPI